MQVITSTTSSDTRVPSDFPLYHILSVSFLLLTQTQIPSSKCLSAFLDIELSNHVSSQLLLSLSLLLSSSTPTPPVTATLSSHLSNSLKLVFHRFTHHTSPITTATFKFPSTAMDFQCQTCPRCFASWVSRNQHMDALDHWAPTYECETCTREFTSQHAANQHMNAVGHWAPKIECDTCTKLFPTQDAANIHMDALGHWEHYCHSCDRKFMGESNLRAVSILVPFIHFFQPLFSLLRFWTDSVQAICLDYWHHFPPQVTIQHFTPRFNINLSTFTPHKE